MTLQARCLDKCGNPSVVLPPYPPSWGGGTTPPDPTILAVTCPTIPNTAVCGAGDLPVRVLGQNFTATCVVYLDNAAQATTFVSATELSFTVQPSTQPIAKTSTITVKDGATNASGVCYFQFTAAPLLTIISLVPATAVCLSADVLVTANCQNLTPTCEILWDGTAVATTPVSSTQCRFTVQPSLEPTPRTAQVGIRDGATMGVGAPIFTFTAAAIAPVITNIDPPCVQCLRANQLVSVFGQNFTSASVIQANGVPVVTVFSSATELQTTVPSSTTTTPRVVNVTVKTGTLVSNALPFNYVLAPTITDILPDVIGTEDTPKLITVTGTGFTADSVIQVGSTDFLTTVVSPTSLTTTIDPIAIGTNGTVPVRVQTCSGQPPIVSNPHDFGIWVNPQMISLTPASSPSAGGDVTVEVRAAGTPTAFSQVLLDGVRATTTVVANVMTVVIPAAPGARTVQVSVTTGGPENDVKPTVPPLSLPFTMT